MSSADHFTLRERPSGRELVLRTIAGHAPSLLGTAHRYSLCADDAQDAYQRALEIFLRRADSVDPQHAVGWLRTVVKHEALAVRAGRLRLVGAGEVDLDRQESIELVGAEERAADRQHAEQAAEALGRLKPQEIRALVLKARGYSYREICEITGWSYTKVNRCLTEGRRAFLDRYGEIASGQECERWAASLSALADGEASPADVAAVRPHLRACPACRATLRDFRAGPGAVAALVAMPAGDSGDGVLGRLWDALAHHLHERATTSALKLQAAAEAASTGKLAAVAASATALAGGGVATVEQARPVPAPVARVAHAPKRARVVRAERPKRAARPEPAGAVGRRRAARPTPTPSERPSEFAPEGHASVGAEAGRPPAQASSARSPTASSELPIPGGESGGGGSSSGGEFSP
jgi:RNA polymerase sigma factor (sigma-70 family)